MSVFIEHYLTILLLPLGTFWDAFIPSVPAHTGPAWEDPCRGVVLSSCRPTAGKEDHVEEGEGLIEKEEGEDKHAET
jgi:hypothetical protein